MSYSFSADKSVKSAVVDAFTRAAAEQREALDPLVQTSFDDHVERLAAALPALVEVTGSDRAAVTVVVSGHANPGHGPREGWADEFVSVAVHAAEPVPAAEEATEGDGEHAPPED